MIQLPRLNDLLLYKNPLVIKRFSIVHPQLTHDAENIFEDMLKYLWLCRKYEFDKEKNSANPDLNFSCVMHKEMADIDEMWHAFILITIEYQKFCFNYFGQFLHHIPEVGTELNENYKVDETIFRNELRLFLSYTYDNLGEETVKRWFSQYL